MKKILFLLISATLAFTAQAQQQKAAKPKHQKVTPEQRAGHKAELLGQQLQLTAAQVNQIKSIMIQRNQVLKSLKEKTNGNEDAFRKEAFAVRKKFQDEMKKTLTEEQFNKFKEMRKANRRNTGAAPKEGDDLIDESELELTK